MVLIAVNDKPLQVPDGLTVAALLSHLGVAVDRVAVLVNSDIVAREEYGRVLVEGDCVELVSFVGGG